MALILTNPSLGSYYNHFHIQGRATKHVAEGNEEGQLGLGHTNEALQPTLVQPEDCLKKPLRCLAAVFCGMILID